MRGGIPAEVRDLVWERAQGWCERCGLALLRGQGGYSQHHRKLRSQGGPDSPENLVLLCGSGTTGCHGWVHAHPTLAKAAGWMVERWAEPAEVTVRLALHGLCRLLSDGGLERVWGPKEPPRDPGAHSLEELGW